MTVIEIDNLYCTIKEYSSRAIVAIDNALSADTPGHQFTDSYKRGQWDGRTRFLNMRSKKFPAGLLSLALNALKRINEEVDLVDIRKGHDRKVHIPDKIELNHSKLGTITLRDYQYDSVVSGITSSRGIVNVATNGGKTEIACGIIKTLLPTLKEGERIVFFTHSKEIFSQSHQRIEERLGIKVGMIGDGKWQEEVVTLVMIPTIQKYIKKPKSLPNVKKYKDLKQDIADLENMVTSQSGLQEEYDRKQEELKSYEKEQWEKINTSIKKTKKFLDSIVAFIGDEVHHASSDTWYKVFMSLKNAHFRYGLTGTVDEEEEINLKRLLGCTGKIISKVSNKFLIENGYSAKPTIFMLDLGNIPSVTSSYYEDARREGIIHNKVRNSVFIDKVLERANSGKQCLIIVNETEHGEVLSSMMDSEFSYDFIHGDCSTKHREESLELFKNGDIRILIATTILDEGVDISGINCLFLLAGGKSMKQLLQRIGRGLRKKDDGSGLEVYDSLDYHNSHLNRHTLERYNTYKEEGFDIRKL